MGAADPRPEFEDNFIADTAARRMVTRVPTARRGESADEARRALAGQTFDCADTLCVVDEKGRLEGVLRLRDLLAAPAEASIESLMTADPPRSLPDTDQEHVAVLAQRRGLAAVPVVDETGRLLGVVPPEALIDVLRREHVEDLHRLAGIMHRDSVALSALEESPWRRLRHRLPWLLVGFAGSVAATAVVAIFEARLQARVALAFFIPAIVYLADAVGTQTEAVAVRGLTLSHVPLWRALRGELAAGLMIGGALALLALPTVGLAFGDWELAATVAITILAASTLAASIGLLLPWLLSRLGQDPAFGSGPVATVIQDVLSLLVYFLVAAVLL